MSYKLEFPYTKQEEREFIVRYNHGLGLQLAYTPSALYALEVDEYIEDGQVLKNLSYYAVEREKAFKEKFFEIPAVGTIFKGGWYRKQPKGYSSATESINTAYNLVTMMGALPKDSLIFYTKPDFYNEEQCSEEWLIANQFRNEAWSKEDFAQFYYAFVTGWNAQEHA